MINTLETPTPDVHPDTTAPDKPTEKKDGKSAPAKSKHLNIIIPSIVVCLCAIAVLFLLYGEMQYSNSVHGKFVCNSSQSEDAYMVFDRDGSYSFYENDTSAPQNGSWKFDSGKIILTEASSGSSETMYFIDSKYLAFDDENFLEGKVPETNLFDAHFTSDDGTVYVFESDGKCYTSEDDRNTELGGYMTDGKFIVITIENTAHTYLNCGDGITPVFFTEA